MQLRNLIVSTLAVSTLAALPLAALAEGNSPWLPIPGQVSLGLNHTEQSGNDAYIGDKQLPLSAITGGAASKYKRATTTLRVDYGFSDSLAFDAAIGYAKVKVGAADSDSGMTDSTLGLRWRALDEYENPALPTLTLRGAASSRAATTVRAWLLSAKAPTATRPRSYWASRSFPRLRCGPKSACRSEATTCPTPPSTSSARASGLRRS